MAACRCLRNSRLDSRCIRLLRNHLSLRCARHALSCKQSRHRLHPDTHALHASRGRAHLWIARGPFWPQVAAGNLRLLLLRYDRSQRFLCQLHHVRHHARVVRSRHGRLLGHRRILCNGKRPVAFARRAQRAPADRLSLRIPRRRRRHADRCSAFRVAVALFHRRARSSPHRGTDVARARVRSMADAARLLDENYLRLSSKSQADIFIPAGADVRYALPLARHPGPISRLS